MVRKREDGRWEGRIVVGHKENGDSIFRYVSAGSQKALTEKLHREMSTYRGVDLTENSRMTLGEWLDQWLEELVAPSVRESTLEGYRHHIQYHIKPRLGSKPRTMSGSCTGMSRIMAVSGRTRSMDTPCPPPASAVSMGCCTWPWTRQCGHGSSP